MRFSRLLAGAFAIACSVGYVAIATACGATPPSESAPGPSGGVMWPAMVDSHVHLAYWPVADSVAASGIGAVVDLAAPERAMAAQRNAPLRVITSGPMLTRVGGYPLASWGGDGYGVGCADIACVRVTVDRLACEGATVIKLALDGDGLPADLVGPAVEAAHAKGMKVLAHALGNDAAMRAATAGVDVLAHTPVEPLAPATIEAWRGRAVVSTLAAFGGSESAVANLRALREGGVMVLYGTDMGNLRDAGPSAQEIELLRAAGLDDAAITDAMTTTPNAYWKLELGPHEQGGDGTYVVLDADPRIDAETLLRPREVYQRGMRVR